MTWMNSSVVVLSLLFSPAGAAQGPPPANVVVAKASEGKLAPTVGLKGTVYYKEVSNLATEVDGLVKEVLFEEGQHIKSGAPMVRLDYTLLEADLQAANARVLQNQAQLAQEQARLERAKSLLADEVTTPQEYDDLRFTVQSMEHLFTASKAEVERIHREVQKKTIYAPFSGVVVDRMTEVGEWKREGDTVAVFARDDVYDVIVNVPEDNLQWIKPGLQTSMVIAGKPVQGNVVAVIPRGDVKMHLFPVKIRVTDQDWLLESMTADVELPMGQATDCTIVPRDAVILDGGQHVLFAVNDGVVARVPVSVLGYDGMQAGIRADAVSPGVEIVTKGQERLRDGQPVSVSGP